MGGGITSCAILGGGGKRTMECALQNQFWRPQKVGLVCSVPTSTKEDDKVWRNGGQKPTIGGVGGAKPFLGRGFTVCFSFFCVFHPPLLLSDSVAERDKLAKHLLRHQSRI